MGKVTQVNEEAVLADIERQLVDEFPHIPSNVVDALIREEHARFTHSRVRDFVPLFVEKHTREELRHRSN
ncbi:hypothetical protein A9X03_14765 [Mycobacterium sp. E1715]|uniref:three-helix bundle dimerization domain-containing protein n=1 Tax=unclassified Mycobacterium TaxID=2642494 RepID=UPI0007FF801B|nr:MULTISPECIES: DUF3562 domain-containing protein [unclassified Mycobacterium]OBG59960.1 hypothetical protein A5703_26240 [Mycobacterium sp. E188]OBG85141.1 hypothetical protein A9X05_01920 [Mycobacterium sp. E3298]OBH23193.1 hypothetical protein A9X03_14765 [Mycobacterium sp. E1715]OBH45146.1 hypothetical protein A5691_15835 [Mycobacterium sp. E183]